MSGTVGKNPEEVGWSWLRTSHALLVVDWEGATARYLVDVGYAGEQCPLPFVFHSPYIPFDFRLTVMHVREYFRIELKDGVRGQSVTSTAYKLSYGPLPIPFSLAGSYLDTTPHYIQYRSQSKIWPVPDTIIPDDPTTGYWSPLFAFILQTASAPDLEMVFYWSCVNPKATFVSLLLVSKVEESGENRVLSYRDPMPKDEPGEDGKKFAKLMEEGEVSWIEMNVGAMKEVL